MYNVSMYDFFTKIKNPDKVLDKTNNLLILCYLADNPNLKDLERLQNRINLALLYGKKTNLEGLALVQNKEILEKIVKIKNMSIFKPLAKNLNLTQEQIFELNKSFVANIDSQEAHYWDLRDKMRLDEGTAFVSPGMPPKSIIEEMNKQEEFPYFMLSLNSFPLDEAENIVKEALDKANARVFYKSLENPNLPENLVLEAFSVGETFSDPDLIVKALNHRNIAKTDLLYSNIRKNYNFKTENKIHILTLFPEKSRKMTEEILGLIQEPMIFSGVVNLNKLFSSEVSPEEILEKLNINFDDFLERMIKQS